MNGRAPAHESGFSLAEMLVTLAILGMAAGLLLAGVVTANVITRQTKADETASVTVSAAQTILRMRLERMRPVKRLDVSDPAMDMRGTDKLFDFFGPPPDADPGRGVQRYRLMLTAPGDLMLYRSPELSSDIDSAAASTAGWQGTVLLRQVAGLSVGYFGSNRDDKSRAWRAFWRNNSRLPEAIRIRVAFRQGDPREWPELIVRPGSTLDVACDPDDRAAPCKGGKG